MIRRKKIVITGINGFVGRHLARKLASLNITVIGVGQDEFVFDDIKDFVSEYHTSDLTKEWPKIDHVDAIIHLAGLAAIGPSFDNPQQYISANSAMVTELCEYYLKKDKKPRILVVSSGAVYNSSQSMPLNEVASIGFSSPYTVSKVLTENQCAYYRSRGLECIITRPFNHIGPGQNKGFILPDFFERLLSLDENEKVIKVGNIASKRDYTDVRDIVDAYIKIALAPTLSYNVYNVCSGKAISGDELLDTLKNLMDKPSVHFEVDPSLLRPTDAPEIYGDSSRLQSELGWKPMYPIRDTIRDFVNSKSL